MKYILFVICVLTNIIVKAQTPDSISKPNCTLHYIKSYGSDIKDIATIPAHLNRSRIICYSATTIGAVCLVQFDTKIRSFIQDNRNEKTDIIAKNVFEPYGSGLYSISLLGAFYLQGVLWKNDRSKELALNGLKAVIIASGIIQIPKYVCRRERPYQSPDDANNWFRSLNNLSFASGHTCAAFAISTTIALEYRKTVWVPILAYAVSTGTGWSRMNDDKHWASDVFVGAAIGYGVAKLIHSSKNWKIRTTPIISPNGLGMIIQW